jgi:3-isopropylmalate/(R)-2-methylmalate dehydratase small subunit
MSANIVGGRVWKFGDNINTDLMLPGDVHAGTEAEQARAVFAANRPGWIDEMKPGDVIIGGRNYGTGSSRPAARSLKNIGIVCLVADSINGLFFRNCVNFGLLALECAGVSELFPEEGQIAEVSLGDLVPNLVSRFRCDGRLVAAGAGALPRRDRARGADARAHQGVWRGKGSGGSGDQCDKGGQGPHI